MKHDRTVTLFLLTLFFTAQVIGLSLLNMDLDVSTVYNETTGQTEIQLHYDDVVTGRPDLEGSSSFVYVFFSIILGTALLLLLMKLKLHKVWKVWFFLAVGLTISIALDVLLSSYIALAIGFLFAYLKLFRPNIFTHNITEIFMYSGIAIMLVPIFDVFWMSMLLLAISLYDTYAVWKSKHMVKLAKFQTESKIFAGILIPYENGAKIHHKIPKGLKTKKVKSAILGGGDIAFPLLFAGSVMDQMLKSGVTKQIAFFRTLIIPIFAGFALYFLLMKGKKDKFYPAMPFISAGCFIGLLVLYLF